MSRPDSHARTPMPGLQCPICGARRFQEGACTGCRTITGILRLPMGQVLGSYRIDDVLGQGGMGVVYLATHTRIDRRVALKVLRPEYSQDLDARNRFFAEARAVNKIAHPNVIEITDFVEDDTQGHYYYVMELLEGVSLAELMSAGGVLGLPRSIAIATQVADALGAVHRAGIVHRDLKPHNVILIERAGRPDFAKLVDFGIAKLVGLQDPTSDPDTAPIFGTPKYMSPEQADGRDVDYRSDLYGLGVMLYELTTGRLPLEGADFRELVSRLRTQQPIAPRDLPDLPHEIPPSLEALIMACLAKQPADRPQSAAEVAARLGAIADEQDSWSMQLRMHHRQSEAEVVEPARPAELAEDDDELPDRAPTRIMMIPDEPILTPVSSGEILAPSHATPGASRRRWPIMLAIGATGALATALVLVVAMRGRSPAPAGRTGMTDKVAAELAIADERIAAGRFVAAGGDEALDHLLAARALDPDHPGVRERLQAIARRFGKLAEEAYAAGSLEEAAAHLQTVLAADPSDAESAARMAEIEAKILERQRRNLGR